MVLYNTLQHGAVEHMVEALPSLFLCFIYPEMDPERRGRDNPQDYVFSSQEQDLRNSTSPLQAHRGGVGVGKQEMFG